MTPEEQLIHNLTNHTPTPDAIKKIEAIRHACKNLGLAILQNAPDSRERSTSITDLEKVLYNAVAAIVRTENEDV